MPMGGLKLAILFDVAGWRYRWVSVVGGWIATILRNRRRERVALSRVYPGLHFVPTWAMTSRTFGALVLARLRERE